MAVQAVVGKAPGNSVHCTGSCGETQCGAALRAAAVCALRPLAVSACGSAGAVSVVRHSVSQKRVAATFRQYSVRLGRSRSVVRHSVSQKRVAGVLAVQRAARQEPSVWCDTPCRRSGWPAFWQYSVRLGRSRSVVRHSVSQKWVAGVFGSTACGSAGASPSRRCRRPEGVIHPMDAPVGCFAGRRSAPCQPRASAAQPGVGFHKGPCGRASDVAPHRRRAETANGRYAADGATCGSAGASPSRMRLALPNALALPL